MKWFYVISLLLVAAMAASPLLFLRTGGQEEYLRRVVVTYQKDGTPVFQDHPTVRFDSFGAPVRSIDPTTIGDTTSAGIGGEIYDGLYTYDYLLTYQGRPVVVPNLAAGMPRISRDRLTPSLPNTRAVRAEDFVLAFKRVADYHNANTSLSWAFLSGHIVGLDEYRRITKINYKAGDFSRYDLPVEGVKALDERTLQVKLIKPYAQFLLVLALDVYAPCPREAVDYWLTGRGSEPVSERSVEFIDPLSAIGTGAYVLHTFEPKHKIVLVRNPDFRKETYPTAAELRSRLPDAAEADRQIADLAAQGLLRDAGRRLPLIDVQYLEYVAEDYSAWMRFLSRRTDASGIPRETFEFVITPDQKLTDSWAKRNIYLHKVWMPAVYWVAFNLEDPVLGASPSLRQAICLAYDVESEIRVLYNGRARRAVNIVPKDFPGWTEAGPGPYYRFDVKAAQAKIEQAKAELAAKGLLDADGQIPEIVFDLSEGGNRQAEFTCQQFSRIGLKIKPVFNDWPTLQQKVHTKQAQMYTMGWHADYFDSENFLQLFYSPNIQKGTNNTNYSNPEFDKLYEKALSLPDGPERTALYVQMIRKISEDVPVLALTEPLSFILTYDWLQNIKLHPVGYGYGKFRRIDTELRRRLGGRN
jgi:oligopeptide transport system substrate-binding protein